MTKEMATAMLVAQRYAETRMVASAAKDAANNLLYRTVNITDDEKDKIGDFMAFCESLMERNRDWRAKEYVEGLQNG